MESANTRAVDSGPGGIGRSPERAEELFTEELLTKLLRTAARLVNAQDADDVVQSVICRFLRSAKANTVVSAVAYLTEAVRRESLTAAAARVRRAARDRWENVDELAGCRRRPESA